MKKEKIMIGIDWGYITPGEVEKRFCYQSISLYCIPIIKELIKDDKYWIIVPKYAENFAKELFATDRVIAVKSLIQSAIIRYYKGNKIGATTIRKNGIFDKKLAKIGVNYVWYPCAVPAVIDYTPGVVTQLDMWPVNHKTKEAYQLMFNKADYIIPSSTYTEREMFNLFPKIDKDKTEVIPIPVSYAFEEIETVDAVNRNFILDVNAFNERKNPLTLLKAFSVFHYKNKDVDLVFCFGSFESELLETARSFVNDHDLSGYVHFIHKASTAQRNWLLKNALLFVTPSLSEGFGLTPVEAMMCGCPVISSDAGPLKDVTLNRARYFSDLKNHIELAGLIEMVINNMPSQKELKETSSLMIDTYSPGKIAKMYDDIISKGYQKHYGTKQM